MVDRPESCQTFDRRLHPAELLQQGIEVGMEGRTVDLIGHTVSLLAVWRPQNSDIYYSCFVPARSGQKSATYFSAASRITHAIDTFFFLAILSKLLYTSPGIVTDVRVEASLFFFVTIAPFLFIHHFTPFWCIQQRNLCSLSKCVAFSVFDRWRVLSVESFWNSAATLQEHFIFLALRR